MRPRYTYEKYFAKELGQNGHPSPKQWSEQSIPAYMGPSRQLDDQHRNTNMNNKDHIVGQLNRGRIKDRLELSRKFIRFDEGRLPLVSFVLG